MRRVLLAHGLEGSPDGRKATALREAGYALEVPDGRGKALAERVDDLEHTLLHIRAGGVLVGSSYGGLAALVLAERHADRLRGLLLCAPALMRCEPPVDDPAALVIPEELPAIVLHGTRDAVVPIALSRALVERCPHARLVELDDDHSLAASTPQLLAAVAELTGW